jgi:hypothetical protein
MRSAWRHVCARKKRSRRCKNRDAVRSLLPTLALIGLTLASAKAAEPIKVEAGRGRNRTAIKLQNEGESLMQKGDLEGARRSLDAAIRSDPTLCPHSLIAPKSFCGSTSGTLRSRIATKCCGRSGLFRKRLCCVLRQTPAPDVTRQPQTKSIMLLVSAARGWIRTPGRSAPEPGSTQPVPIHRFEMCSKQSKMRRSRARLRIGNTRV